MGLQRLDIGDMDLEFFLSSLAPRLMRDSAKIKKKSENILKYNKKLKKRQELYAKKGKKKKC